MSCHPSLHLIFVSFHHFITESNHNGELKTSAQCLPNGYNCSIEIKSLHLVLFLLTKIAYKGITNCALSTGLDHAISV